jgi:hypothetical protein
MIRLRQITNDDLNSVADLLSRGFPRRSRQDWLKALNRLAKHATPAGFPTYGYLLESQNAPVGVVLLISSTIRSSDSSTVRSNLSSWYFEPAYRSYAALIVPQVAKRKDITYLNVSPEKHTLPILEVQGFSKYSAGQFVAVPVPYAPIGAARIRVFDVSEPPDAHFEPFERDLLLQHAEYGCISLWCTTSERAYPFVFRPRIVKGLLPCAQLVYCREIEDLPRFAWPIGRFVALRGRPMIIVDSNGPISGLLGKYFDGVAPKYFKGPSPPRLGDLAYTELAMFGL